MNESFERPPLEKPEVKILKFLTKRSLPVSPDNLSKDIELPKDETLNLCQKLSDKGLLEFAPIRPYEKLSGANVGLRITDEGRQVASQL